MASKIMLLGIIFISFIAKNKPMVLGGIIVFILSFINNQGLNRYIKNNSLNIGLVFLIIWLLLPILEIPREISISSTKSYLNLNGLISFISGLFVVIIAGKGLNYLNGNTSAIGGIILGSIVGVTFFEGIPVGMLTASGIAYLIIKCIKR
ncbi:DUF441 family protein [Anaerosalibacter sp. Marseille-P3206]|uniref:DUF441 family protein n=1 Tax=Anaerosalibacter sp. Marseille-P3206 TaxID=1871005 RepID=UPI000987CF36|nr:DUF441 family protein [Anaerosalibacter sp. Marseille-P3206]